MNKKGMVLKQHPPKKEVDLQPREVMVQRFAIITEEEKYKWSLLQDMVSYANDNSEKYIPENNVNEATLIKTPRPDNLDPVKKLDDYLQELLKQKKSPQDIVIDNILEKVQDKVLDIMGRLSKL